MPTWLATGIFTVAADAVWLVRGGGVRQLEANLARIRPDLTPARVRRLSRHGMRSYFRYFREAFQLPRLTPEQIDARVRVIGVEPIREHLSAGRSVVIAVGHVGNWDLAGAWFARHVGPVTTVAERLEPAEMFEEFLRLREGVGLRIVPFETDGSTFRILVREAHAGGKVIPLLADRDLGASGVEVLIAGHPARVAAGPAALAGTGSYPLAPAVITYERLHGDRRRRAGSRWGIVIDFLPAIVPPTAVTRGEAVAAMTQGWVSALFDVVAQHPQDWHMLQKVFLADLDPQRLKPAGLASTEATEAVPPEARP